MRRRHDDRQQQKRRERDEQREPQQPRRAARRHDQHSPSQHVSQAKGRARRSRGRRAHADALSARERLRQYRHADPRPFRARSMQAVDAAGRVAR
eukprot:3360707-Prymnesium_polylepis.1